MNKTITPDKLRDFRTRHELTQKELSGMIGVSAKTISSWESGQSQIPLWTEKFLECLDLISQHHSSWMVEYRKQQDGRRKHDPPKELNEQERLEGMGQARLF